MPSPDATGAPDATRKEQKKDASPAAPTPDPGKDKLLEGHEARILALEGEQQRLKDELGDQRDRFLRARADYENLARRTQKEAVDAARTAKAGLLLRLINVAETLERAVADLERMDAEHAKGVKLVLEDARKVLRDEGVKEVEGVGHMFNYRHHQAIERVETAQGKDGTILEVVQRGYTMGTDVLRPGLVKVAVARAKPAAPATAAPSPASGQAAPGKAATA